MKPYTVVLLLPDYVAGQYGETYCAHVDAKTTPGAIFTARRDAARAHGYFAPAVDYAPMFVCEGHHNDLAVTL